MPAIPEAMGSASQPQNRAGGGRVKVKSGCRTCKIRKIKCDEGRPKCHRCVSTGRACDGYGIWDQSPTSSRDLRVASGSFAAVPRPQRSISVSPLWSREPGLFEWFRHRVATKLPGTFFSGFWSTLIHQANLTEPAVSHAVLALSFVHMAGSREIGTRIVAGETPCQSHESYAANERFVLQNYVASIGLLQPHFARRNRASFRVALITCLVFMSLELFRSNFESAKTHLENGLGVLREMQFLSSGNHEEFCPTRRDESDDGWILETFSRMQLHVALLEQMHNHSCLLLQMPRPSEPLLEFRSVKEAWIELERLLDDTFRLTQQRHGHTGCQEDFNSPFEQVERRKNVQRQLEQWLDTYKNFEQGSHGRLAVEPEKCKHLLSAYHSMACIMAGSCLEATDESVYDSFTSRFLSLLGQLIGVLLIGPARVLPGRQLDSERSLIDVGWIPPLYFIAVKCRVHRIRLQAVKLLESSCHREGFWDSRLTACVARKVMEVEESGYFADLPADDSFSLASWPSPQDLSLPTLPARHRIREIEMALLGAPTDRILLSCEKGEAGVAGMRIESVYHVSSQRWIDTHGPRWSKEAE